MVFEIANICWKNQIRCEIFYTRLKIAEQVAKAISRGGKILILVGEEEFRQGNVILKNLHTKK
jgi:histidyl-tRNA synthetase